MQTSIDEGINEDSKRQAKELLAKLAEYKPLAKIDELEEQNYNMSVYFDYHFFKKLKRSRITPTPPSMCPQTHTPIAVYSIL